MIDATLVSSGFDTETLLSARYVSYVLLAQIEAGLLSTRMRLVQPPEGDDAGYDLDVTIHPPGDYRRLYDPHPDAPLPEVRDSTFEVDVLFDHRSGADLRIGLFVGVVDAVSGRSIEAGMDLFATLGLRFEQDGAFQRNHMLALEVVDVGGALVAAARGVGVEREELLAGVKEAVDREVPLGFTGGRVQRIALHKLAGGVGTRDAIGLYVNLALRTGPERGAFLEDRGDVAAAQNFLALGEDLAFSTSPTLFSILGPDAFARMAEKDGEGGFHFPLRERPEDPDSKVVGRLKGIRVGPEVRVGGDDQVVPTGGLAIRVNAEWTDSPIGNPDIAFLIFLRPRIEDGLLRWEMETDVRTGPAGVLAALVAGAVLGGLTLNFAFGLGVFLAALAELELTVEPLLARRFSSEADKADLSFLDALPHRVPAATRRWDPVYETRHQVVTLLDEIRIDFTGIAFEGSAVLGRDPHPLPGAVPRDEERDARGTVTHLRYRVNDFPAHEDDFAALAPGTDRRTFRRADPSGEPTLVSLTPEDLAERIVPDRRDGPARVAAPAALLPRRVHTVSGQIDHILCVSRREIEEQRGRLVRAFRARTRSEIEAGDGERIRTEETERLEEELGRPPTADELDDAVEARIDGLVDEAQEAFEEEELPPLLSEAMDALLRFDLAPEEFAAFENAGVLLIEGKVIVVREGTPYYRDRPDGSTEDNLLALPRYRPPFLPASTDTTRPPPSDTAGSRAAAVGAVRR